MADCRQTGRPGARSLRRPLAFELSSAWQTGRRLQFHALAARGAEIWEQGGEEADQREIGADVEDEGKAVAIGQGAEEGGAEAAQAEGEAEEEAGHRADFAGDELLRVVENAGNGGASAAVVGRAMLAYDPNMTLRALVHSAEEGGYWAEVPALPGCVSQGETVEELRTNIREAIEGWLLAADPPTLGYGAAGK